MSLFMNTQEKIEHQKWIAEGVLNKLFSIDPHSIVAGGAPRDWYLGKPATDIDVFFYAGDFTFGTMELMLKHVGIDILCIQSGDNIPSWYKLNPNLKAVYNVKVEGVAVQLMWMNQSTFYSVVDQFPLSICKVWYKNRRVVAEKDFLRSVRYKAIVKTNTIYNNEHAYVEKILRKFPDYEYYETWEKVAEKLLDSN